MLTQERKREGERQRKRSKKSFRSKKAWEEKINKKMWQKDRQ